MTQTTESTSWPATPGAYLVDTSTTNLGGRPSPPWVGRVQMPLDSGRVQLVTHTGYGWPADPENLREATAAERAAYDTSRARWIRTPIPGVRP
ncbi:hypothetical protein [Streptomyces axinellae]|uniref:Uncharacterized protein n=1 Tax=Streptomyces axinellae TaxID=552788 RepID=A0ABP6C6D9_9ACTN